MPKRSGGVAVDLNQQPLASLRGVGCDCLGLARGVWREVVGPEPFPIPPYSRDWGETGPREALAEGPPEPRGFEGDPTLIARALANLIDNALRQLAWSTRPDALRLLVIAGNESTDGVGGAVPAIIAEYLGLPQLTHIRKLTVDGDKLLLDVGSPDGKGESDVPDKFEWSVGVFFQTIEQSADRYDWSSESWCPESAFDDPGTWAPFPGDSSAVRAAKETFGRVSSATASRPRSPARRGATPRAASSAPTASSPS